MQGMEEENRQGEKMRSEEGRSLLGVEKFLETTTSFFEVDMLNPESIRVMEE